MNKIHVTCSVIIEAHPQDIYAVLSDYRVGHPAILPKPYFTELTVEKGGQGAGTVIQVRVKVFGKESHCHAVVTEPTPGRVLLETDLDTGQFTYFTVEPLDGGKHSRVTIASEFPSKSGLMGLMEKLMQPPVVRYIYKKELRQVADYLHRNHAAATLS